MLELRVKGTAFAMLAMFDLSNRLSSRNVPSSYLTHEVVELATIALLLVLVFTLLLDVFLPGSQISFTALLEEEVEVSVCLDVSPTSSVVSDSDVFSLLDELFPTFCTIFI